MDLKSAHEAISYKLHNCSSALQTAQNALAEQKTCVNQISQLAGTLIKKPENYQKENDL